MKADTFQQIKTLIDESNDIFIAIDKKADVDSIAAALSLYLSLAAAGKNVIVASPMTPTVELAQFVGINKLTNELSGRKFIISLKDVIGRVEKVTYYSEGNELNLVVHTLPDAQPFSKDQVNFKDSGPEAQLIILVGVTDLNNLGNLYVHDKEIYSNSPIITIQKDNNTLANNSLEIGQNNASISEVVSHLISSLDLPFNADIASNLYNGIIAATDNFQKTNITPQSFEAAAICLRVKGLPQSETQSQKMKKDEPQISQQDQGPEDKDDVKPKKDWLQPKIYRSSKNL